MIEERARVVSVDRESIRVETVRRSACDSCQLRNGCGQSVLQRMGLGARQGVLQLAQTEPASRVGDEIIIGIPEEAVVRGSAVVYMVPLLLLFSGALAAQYLGAAEPWIILGGLTGLVSGFAAVRWHGRRVQGRQTFVPRVLRRVM